MEIEHLFLVKAENKEEAWLKIKRFLENYELISYEKLVPVWEEALNLKEKVFTQHLQQAVEVNRQRLYEFLLTLRNEGYESILDLLSLPQGYLSKQLHLISHFLDGFFGVDSYFYNLEEDSHWLSPLLKRKIESGREMFWLVKVKVFAPSLEPDFEKLRDPLR